jgi:hypothetical protein
MNKEASRLIKQPLKSFIETQTVDNHGKSLKTRPSRKAVVNDEVEQALEQLERHKANRQDNNVNTPQPIGSIIPLSHCKDQSELCFHRYVYFGS